MVAKKYVEYRARIRQYLTSRHYALAAVMVRELGIPHRCFYRLVARLREEGKVSLHFGILYSTGSGAIISERELCKRLDISIDTLWEWTRRGVIKKPRGWGVIPVADVVAGLNRIRVGAPVAEIPVCYQQNRVARLLQKERRGLGIWKRRGLPYFACGDVLLYPVAELADWLRAYISNPPPFTPARRQLERLQAVLAGMNLPT